MDEKKEGQLGKMRMGGGGGGSWRTEMEKMKRCGMKAKGDSKVRIWLMLSSQESQLPSRATAVLKSYRLKTP